MAFNEWDPDDLLDFKYDNPVPRSKDTENEFEVFDRLTESNRQQPAGRGLGDTFDYSEFRHSEAKPQKSVPVERFYDAPETAAKRPPKVDPLPEDHFFEKFDYARSEKAKKQPVELPEEKKFHSPVELDAIKQASQDAYDRYRSNYVKNAAKKAGKMQLSKAKRILMGIYGVALAAFVISMTVMNVLPGGLLIALYVILGLLTVIIFMQMRRRKFKPWSRRLATVLTVVLIFVYGMGTVYSMGTLSFLRSTSVENYAAVKNITKDPFNVVITGIDTTGTINEKGRSDVNMIVTVNPKTATILMTSIPRDYEIHMPDYDNAVDKLTHTGVYGVLATIIAEEDLLDFTSNYYVKVNFTTVEKFIDAIGGVDVYSDVAFTPSLAAWPTDYKKNPEKHPEMDTFEVHEGMNHMTGGEALAFARERKAFNDGDRTRIKNQQAVFEAMIKKATSSKTMLLSYNKILTSLRDYFEMSFSSEELRALIKYQLKQNPNWQIYRNQITGGDGSMTTYTTGDEYCYVMTQDPESINNAKALIQAVMNGEQVDKDEDGNVFIVQTEEETE